MEYRNPTPTVDVVVQLGGSTLSILLIERKNPPLGWALPGGFVDEGETVEHAARREVQEEVNLHVVLDELLYVYSDPRRDPRKHTLSVAFIGTAPDGARPRAGDDAATVRIVTIEELTAALAQSPPSIDGMPIVFDHAVILADYLGWLTHGSRPKPRSV